MAWRVVKQPNGLFAIFSDVVDNFTYINMTKEEAIEVCREDLGRQQAIDKVQRAIDEDDVMGTPLNEPSPDGLRRWRDSLERIKRCHGEREIKSLKKEIDKISAP